MGLFAGKATYSYVSIYIYEYGVERDYAGKQLTNKNLRKPWL